LIINYVVFLSSHPEKIQINYSLNKNNFIIITGGPGGGKTSILEALLQKGFDYIIESGRQIIRERKIKGLPPRPDPASFARLMFLKDFDNYNKNLNKQSLLFFDRSFLDGAMLIQRNDEIYFEEIRDIINTHRFKTKVFFTPPWQEIYTIDYERDQGFEEAVETYENLHGWYKSQGYEPVIIPIGPIAGRVEFILNELSAEGVTM
jgi:predicted ATPase